MLRVKKEVMLRIVNLELFSVVSKFYILYIKRLSQQSSLVFYEYLPLSSQSSCFFRQFSYFCHRLSIGGRQKSPHRRSSVSFIIRYVIFISTIVMF